MVLCDDSKKREGRLLNEVSSGGLGYFLFFFSFFSMYLKRESTCVFSSSFFCVLRATRDKFDRIDL